jgi:hypothetical protein
MIFSGLMNSGGTVDRNTSEIIGMDSEGQKTYMVQIS